MPKNKENYNIFSPQGLKFLEKLIKKKKKKPFKASAFYNEAGDIIDVIWKDCSYYAKWLNHQVTLLKEQGTDEIVGVQIWALDEGGKNLRISKVIKKYNKDTKNGS